MPIHGPLPRPAPDAPPRLLIISGAGLSAPSGIATFRASDGLWAGHDIRKVCSADTWRDNRDAVHAFYNGRRTELARAEPNAAHAILAAWEKQPGTVHLTQNVDDLCERAGGDPLHLHGFLPDMKCVACGEQWRIGTRAWNHEEERCPKCASSKGVKPAIVFFGDSAPGYTDLRRQLDALRTSDILLCVGTSGVVLPVAAYAHAVPAQSIFVAADEPGENIRESFDLVKLGCCTEVLPGIEPLIADKLGWIRR
jgi:NAD-dependent deacetylase